MSEGETRNPEEAAAGGGEWTNQEWPPFNTEQETTAEDGTVKDADYYREHPSEIGDFVHDLVDLRGGEEKIKEGATWDKEKRAYVDAHGVPREWMQLTGYLKRNPDQLDRLVEEYQNLKYFKEHPEELNKFVAELVRLRGGEDGIHQGTWDTEQVTHVDADGAPRDYAHLTGYLKSNPDQLSRFVTEYMDLKAVEDAANAAANGAPEIPEAEAASGEPNNGENAPDADGGDGTPTDDGAENAPDADGGEGTQADDSESNGGDGADGSGEDGPTPRAPETAEDGADGDGESTDDGAETPTGDDGAENAPDADGGDGTPTDDGAENAPDTDGGDGADGSGEDGADGEKSADTPTPDDIAYQEWLRGRAEQVDDLHVKKEGETDEAFQKRREWEELVVDRAGKFPRFRWSKGGEYPEGVDHAAYDEFLKNHKDGTDETDEEWLKRVGLPSLADFLKGAKPFDPTEATNPDDEVGPHKKWSEMTKDEKKRLIKENPRKPGEKTVDYAKRLGIKGEIPDDSETEDDGEKEKSREEMLAALDTHDAKAWMKDRYRITEDFLSHMSDEDLKKLYDEYMNRGKKNDEEPKPPVDTPKPPEDKPGEPEDVEVDDPLVMARIDRTRDARAAAHDIAERMMSERLANGRGIRGLVQRVVVGGMFREGVIRRYEHRAYDMIRAKQNGAEVAELSDNDWATRSGLERFVTAYVDGYEDEMIHGQAGESMDVYRVETDENGNEVVVRHFRGENGQRQQETLESGAMHDATIQMRDAIRAFAQSGNRAAFEQEMNDIREELMGNGGDPNELMADNYMAVAEAARARYEHGKGIDDVMAGFAFINGEARSNIRTEAHRDAVDRITERLTNSVVGRCLPPEVIGTAASLAVRFGGNTTLRTALIAGGAAIVGTAVAPAVVPVVAGMATAGVLSAVRERNRVTGDRATQARRLAQNDERGTTGYDERMSQTQYEQRSAESVTANLNEALESGDTDQIRDALALADTMVSMSDDRRIDLIKYSNGNTDQIERERMDMDVARARARAELRRRNVPEAALNEAVHTATELFERDISAKDRAFRQLRRRRMAAQGVRSAVVSGVMSVASQELWAMVRPDQVGVLEQAGLSIQENNANATNTLLGGVLGFQGGRVVGQRMVEQGVELTQDQLRAIEADPTRVAVPGQPKVIETQREVSLAEFSEANENAHLAGYFGNGTKGSDGNELRGVYNATSGEGRGPWMRLKGDSWGSGLRVHTEDLTSENVGFMVTIDGHKILCPAVAGDKPGVFYPDYSKIDSNLGTIIRERLFGRIQGVYMPGTTTNGKIDCYSFWGFSGKNNASGTIMTTVREAIPTYDVITETTTMEGVARDATGFATFGGTSRRNLTLGRRANGNGPTTTGGRPGTHVPPAPAPAPEGGETRPDNPSGGDGPEPPTPPNPPAGGGDRPEPPTPPNPPTGGGDGPEPPTPPIPPTGGGSAEAAPKPAPVETDESGGDDGSADVKPKDEDDESAPAPAPESAPAPAPAPAPESTPSKTNPAPAPAGGEDGEDAVENSSVNTAGEGVSAERFSGALNLDSENLLLNPTVDQIRAVAAANGTPNLSNEALQSVIMAIRGWNAMDDDVRRTYLRQGKYSNAYLETLEKVGLLEAEDTPARVEAKRAAEEAAQQAAIDDIVENHDELAA